MSNVKKIVVQSTTRQEITATEIQINNKQITTPVTFVASSFQSNLEMTPEQMQILVNGNKIYANWRVTTVHTNDGQYGFITMTFTTPLPFDEIDEVYVYSRYQAGFDYRMTYDIILYDENDVEISKRRTQEIYDKSNSVIAYVIANFKESDSVVMNLESVKEISYEKIRYIRDYLNGSNVNTSSHWVEIEAYENGVNIALNKTVTSPYTIVGISRITDGDTNTFNYADHNSPGLVYVDVDLGALYNITNIKVWHYYDDGRTYNDTRTQVSVDGITWIDVFNSAIEGTYAEQSAGYSIPINSSTFNSTFIGSEVVASTEKTMMGNIQTKDDSPMVEYMQINTHTGEISKSPQLYNSTWDSIKVSNTDNDDYITFNTTTTPPGITDIDTGYGTSTWNCFVNGWYLALTTEGVSELRPFINGAKWFVRYKITGTTAAGIESYLTFIRKN